MHSASYLIPLLGENRIMMLPREIKDRDGDFKQTAVGTGPYLHKDFQKGTRLSLVKNPDYFLKGQPGDRARRKRLADNG